MFKRNKKKYLIAFDMDGTLLKSDNTVGKKSRRIIKKLVKWVTTSQLLAEDLLE